MENPQTALKIARRHLDARKAQGADPAKLVSPDELLARIPPEQYEAWYDVYLTDEEKAADRAYGEWEIDQFAAAREKHIAAARAANPGNSSRYLVLATEEPANEILEIEETTTYKVIDTEFGLVEASRGTREEAQAIADKYNL